VTFENTIFKQEQMLIMKDNG